MPSGGTPTSARVDPPRKPHQRSLCSAARVPPPAGHGAHRQGWHGKIVRSHPSAAGGAGAALVGAWKGTWDLYLALEEQEALHAAARTKETNCRWCR